MYIFMVLWQCMQSSAMFWCLMMGEACGLFCEVGFGCGGSCVGLVWLLAGGRGWQDGEGFDCSALFFMMGGLVGLGWSGLFM